MADRTDHATDTHVPGDHVWDLIKDIPMALLVTHDGGLLDARPMSAFVRHDEGRIYIMANAGEDSDRQINANPNTVLSFQDSLTFVTVYGAAETSNDRAKIAELWTPFAKAWWDSPEDPRIRLISITPDSAEYWESPGKAVAYVKMLVAAATGTRPDVGKHGTTRL
jgi:general stress protein 26